MDPFTPEQVDYLAKYLAKEFISRTDVKAEQMPFHKGSAYRPIHKPWKMGDLRAHVRGDSTFGHYLLDQDSMVKFIAFDIDLEKTGTYCDFSFKNQEAMMQADMEPEDYFEFFECNPREAWLDRRHAGRPWFKYQMRQLSEVFERSMANLGLKTLSTYSGSKGVHVYGIFGELVPAESARKVAHTVVEDVCDWSPLNGNVSMNTSKGKNFYKLEAKPDRDVSGLDRFDNFSVEIFPKQSYIEPLRLGNLMRLDFGKNLKAPKEPTFVIDTKRPLTDLAPHGTFEELKGVLENGNQW